MRSQKRERGSRGHDILEELAETSKLKVEHRDLGEGDPFLECRGYLTDRQRKYIEHCADIDPDSELADMKLSWAEFCCQKPISEDEFGPEDTIKTVFDDKLHTQWQSKQEETEWRLQVHRLHEVTKMKLLRMIKEDEEKSGIDQASTDNWYREMSFEKL